MQKPYKMKPRILTITETYNGYFLRWGDGADESEVVEERTDTEDLFKRLLERTANYFGYGYDPFNNKNLNIKFNKKGDEWCPPYEPQDNKKTPQDI